MQRLLKLSGFVVLVTAINLVTLMVMVGPMTSRGGGCPVGPGEAECNGDVNGDQQIDIADVFYLAAYLFQGGQPPVAIAGGLTPEQEEILSLMSIEFLDDGQGGTAKTFRLTGVNLQVVNGLGATNGIPGDPESTFGTVNGLGNLIVAVIIFSTTMGLAIGHGILSPPAENVIFQILNVILLIIQV